MIPNASITAWRRVVPWSSAAQVEQDLVLSRLILEIANDPLLGDELVFRGGTCLHKLHLPAPYRYSEDLDYVRRTNTPIGPVFDALRSIGERLRMKVNTEITRHPKVYLRAPFEDASGRMRIKVEMNTFETSPAVELVRLPLAVSSPWWSGSADVLTFRTEELMATKIRALYQRRKGRDLFDLWLAVAQVGIDPAAIADAFPPYRPDGFSADRAVEVLRHHLAHPVFRADIEALASVLPFDYDVDSAGELIIEQVLRNLGGGASR